MGEVVEEPMSIWSGRVQALIISRPQNPCTLALPCVAGLSSCACASFSVPSCAGELPLPSRGCCDKQTAHFGLEQCSRKIQARDQKP